MLWPGAGDNGCLRLEGPVSSSEYAEFIQGNHKERLCEDGQGGTLTAEMCEFGRQLKEKDYPACYDMLGQTLLVMELLVMARKDAGIVFGTDL